MAGEERKQLTQPVALLALQHARLVDGCIADEPRIRAIVLELLVQRTEINQVPSKFLSEAGLQFRNRRIVPIDAVLGGFHLMPMPLDYVRSTVAALKEINPDVLIPMHCSGTTFYEVAKQEMPGRVLLSSTGTRFTFGG